ncbi:hypothetical protein EBQ90_11790 [bacterium]|nr:hypothetical protein [bacterium]
MNLTRIVSTLFFIFCALALILHPEMGEKRDWALYYACFFSILVGYGVILFGRAKKSISEQEGLAPFRFSKWDGFALVFLALNCLRPYDLQGTLFHHHSFYVGPAELLGQGFIPLREIPSQYGFLTYVLTAAMPFGSAWTNFLVLNRVFLFFTSLTVYFSMRLLFPRPQRIPTLLGLTFLSVFVWVGWVDKLQGPLSYPSTSGFRFLPSFLLILIALVMTQIGLFNPKHPRTLKVLNLSGFFVWGLSSLWSVDSFLYATGAWISFQLSWALLHGLRVQPLLKCIFSFLIVGVIIWGSFLLIYNSSYGFYPEVSALWEYAVAYQSGFGALPIKALSPGWLFLLLFITGTVLGASLLKKGSPLFPLVTATLGWLFVCASYYISRSHPNNFSNLMAQVVVSLSVFYFAADRLSEPQTKPVLFKRILSWGGLVLMVPLINIAHLGHLIADWGAPQILPTAAELPPTSAEKQKELEQALSELKIGNQEPWVLLDVALETSPVSSLQSERWVPISPGSAFAVLPPERQKAYLERVALRNRKGGWLVFKIENEPLFKELPKLLSGNFEKREERSFQDWRAVYFQFKDRS